MKALIDGDIPVYRMGWAVQKTHYQHKDTGEFFDGKRKATNWFKENYPDMLFDESEWDIVEEIEPWKECQFLLDKCISEIMEATQADDYEVYLSPSKCFRHDIATIRPYKGNRRPPPFYKDKNREHLINFYRAKIGNNIEADDMLGLNQTTDTVICSIDKDLQMIPGRHYNIVTGEKFTVDLLEADSLFFGQLIAGDSVDNIQGIPQLGLKKAMNIVDMYGGDHIELVEHINDLYDEHYPGQGMQVRDEMAQLVYILRRGDKPGQEQWRSLLNPTNLNSSTTKQND